MKHETKAAAAAFFLAGALLGGPTVHAAAGTLAEPTWQKIYVNGREASMTAYNIAGNNYVRLRDIGQAAGFNVYWEDGVQIDTTQPYTGEAPAKHRADLEAVRQEMIQRINQVRRENGVSGLKVDDSLMAAAQALSAGCYTSHHTRIECETALGQGYPYGFSANLTVFSSVSGDVIAERAVQNWINSPGHFQSMLQPEGTDAGVGVTVCDGWIYCYLLIGKPGSHNPYE